MTSPSLYQPREEKIISPYEPCPACGGSGLALNMAGEPDHCRECDDGIVRARDAKGRFVGNSMRFRT